MLVSYLEQRDAGLAGDRPPSFETGNTMHKFVATLIAGLLAASVHAQTAQVKPQHESKHQTSANTAPIGQAVSGHNSTAAGVSGTGLRTDGSANTGSAHVGTGMQAAGVNAKGKVVGKSTAVIGVAPGKSDNVNAQATNTTAPTGKAADAEATGGRGKAGTKAEKEVRKSNATKVNEPVGSRVKTAESAQAGIDKRAEVKEKSDRKAADRAAGGNGENR
jgi:cytoskeletal protein RodZ